MDYDIELFPFKHKANHIVKEGDDWVITREFRKLVYQHRHNQLFMRIYDKSGLAGIVLTPEFAIRLGENYVRQGTSALQTPFVGHQNFWKPLTIIDSYKNSREPTILVLKNNHPPEIILVMTVEDFRSLHRLFADALSLNYIKAFKED